MKDEISLVVSRLLEMELDGEGAKNCDKYQTRDSEVVLPRVGKIPASLKSVVFLLMCDCFLAALLQSHLATFYLLSQCLKNARFSLCIPIPFWNIEKTAMHTENHYSYCQP